MENVMYQAKNVHNIKVKTGFKFKDQGSAITHLIAFIMAFEGTFFLIGRAARTGEAVKVISTAVFMVSMVLLYAASTCYHTFDINDRVNKVLKKLDHAMIFILIAGTYTPVCLLGIKGSVGTALLALVWTVGILGIIFKMFWVTCPKWLSSVIYILMGWLCVFAFKPIITNVSRGAFLWLLIGGIIYTVGGVCYAIKTKKVLAFNERHKNFGTHEIFHIFVMLGSVCHFVLVYVYLI